MSINTLLNLVNSNGDKLFTENDLNRLQRILAGLTTKMGESLSDFSNPEYLYFFSSLAIKYSLDDVIKFIENRDDDGNIEQWPDIITMFLSEPDMINERIKHLRSVAKFHATFINEGSEKCRKCGSFNTVTQEKQLRSSDEPTSIKVICNDCGVVWRIQ